MICENTGVDYERSEKLHAAEEERGELESLIQDADPGTIADVLKYLKEKKGKSEL